MRSLLRTLRGLLGLGLVWAVAWVPLTVGIGVVERILAGSSGAVCAVGSVKLAQANEMQIESHADLRSSHLLDARQPL